MTAAGVLYLEKYTPHICTMFTTHATITGRCIASNYQPLYQNLGEYNGFVKAHEFNVTAKHSLEKIAARVADTFTTVSTITANECKYLLEKEVDIVTPNGFESDFVPHEKEFIEKRKIARNKIFDIVSALTNQQYDEDTLIVMNSGRYEFRNKGIDVFIDSIANIRNNKTTDKKIIALITVPANHGGVRQDLLDKLNSKEKTDLPNPYLTHNLHEFNYDQVVRKINECGLNNPGDVSIIFVPCYLNEQDGLFNMEYYDLLIGADLTVFASYYEPWGYTPLESLAFKIPTITTSLSGFGQWINDKVKTIVDGAVVIERSETNIDQVVSEISKTITDYSKLSKSEVTKARNNSEKLSESARWEELIQYYEKAYSIGLSKNVERYRTAEQTPVSIETYEGTKILSNEPSWKKMRVLTDIPSSMDGLMKLAMNVWWSWSYEAESAFQIY